MADQSAYEKLLELMGRKRESSADSLAYIQALQPLSSQAWMNDHAKRMGKVQDAYWASKCPDYEPPEPDMGVNLVNCSITSDAAVRQLAALIGEEGGTQPTPPPVAAPGKWWKRLLAAMLLLSAVILGATLIWLTMEWFGGGNEAYEIIAEPWKPPT